MGAYRKWEAQLVPSLPAFQVSAIAVHVPALPRSLCIERQAGGQVLQRKVDARIDIPGDTGLGHRDEEPTLSAM